MYDTHEDLSWQPQIFYICKPYLFLDIYDPWSIPSLAVLFNNNNEFYIASYPGDTFSKMLYMSMEVLRQ